MKKLILMSFILLLLVGTISAVEWNDKLTYSNDDLKVSLENWWGLGETIGIAELKSHETVAEIKYVIEGKNRIVMYYDFNFSESYIDGLREVTFTDMRTGRKIQKDYYFAKEIREDVVVLDYKTNCVVKQDLGNGTILEDCSRNVIGSHTESKFIRWERLNNNDIPKGITRIALITDVNPNEYIDGVWTIAGKKVSRHAQWTASLNIGLLSVYDCTNKTGVSGLIDEVSGRNGTIGNSPTNVTGIRGDGCGFQAADTDHFNITNSIMQDTGTNGTYAFWVKSNSTNINHFLVGKVTSPQGTFWMNFPGANIQFRLAINTPTQVLLDANGSLLANDTFHSIIWMWDNVDGHSLYINGVISATDPTTQIPDFLYFNLGIRVQGAILEGGDSEQDEIYIWNRTLTADEIATVSDGTAFFTNVFIPTITLNSPVNTFNSTNQTINFNGTVTSVEGITNVTLFIDGVLNETNSSAINDTDYLFTKIISDGNHNWTYESCNSNGCTTANARTFTISGFTENSFTFNSSSFETETQTFTINVTTDGTTPSAASLTFDGTENTEATITSLNGDNFNITKSISIPTSIGTKTFFFNLTIGGSVSNSTARSQIVNATNFTLCEAAPLNIPFLNITFKNETLAQGDVNATISSTFVFSLSALADANKTLIFTNATENLNYTFCATPNDRTFNIQLDMDYDNSISQQRSFSLTTALTNSITTQTLFLLPTALGIFSPFKTTNINGDTISFVSAVITRVLSGSTITVGTGLTDSSGFATFFLDPNTAHIATFSKTGFANNVFTFTPSTNLRTVVMGGGGVISNGTIITRGIDYVISPINTTLPNNTIVSFTFNVTSNLTTINLISMNITNSSNAQLLFVSNAGVGNLSGTLNTLNNTKLFGSFIIETAEETISVTRTWTIFTTFIGDYSIFRQLTLTKDNELISDFTRLLLVLALMFGVLIFMSVGQILETSESKIAVLLLLTWAFSLVGWLDTGLAVSTTNTGINRLGEFSNQFGIAILASGASILFIFRRIFIRRP